jgi:hypothetical protein
MHWLCLVGRNCSLMPRLVHQAPMVLVPLRLPADVVEFADQIAAETGVGRIEVIRAMCLAAIHNPAFVRNELKNRSKPRRSNEDSRPKDQKEAADLVRRYAQDAILAAINADRAADRQRKAEGEFNEAREAASPWLTRSQVMSIWDVAYDEARKAERVNQQREQRGRGVRAR